MTVRVPYDSGQDGALAKGQASRPVVFLTQQVSFYHAARYRAAAKRFERVVVLSMTRDADFREFLAGDVDDLDVVELFGGGREAYRSAVRDGTLTQRVAGALAALDPRAIFVAGWAFPESLVAIEWARRHGRKTVLMSESQERDGKRSRFREHVKGIIVGTAQAALVSGPRQGAYLQSLGFPPDRIEFGYSAVDNTYFAQEASAARDDATRIRRELALPERFILGSGRMIPKKNFLGLLRSYAQAIGGDISAPSLVILGDGPEKPRLEAEIRALGLGGKVLLPGFQSYEALPAYYGLACAFAHVPLTEQWGLVVNEAAASGLPVVVSAACGASDLVEPGVSGFIVEADQSENMTAALRNLVSMSEADLRRMGEVGRSRVAAWGPDRFAHGASRALAIATAQRPRALSLRERVAFAALARTTFEKVP